MKENSLAAGSYIVSDFTADIDNEIRRLKAQVELFWEEESGIYSRLKLKPGSSVLECGSGPGFFVAKLASAYPQARFHSLEIEDAYVRYQRRMLADAGITNVEVHAGAIENNALTKGSYDVVFSRLVIEHVPDIDRAFESLISLLKPNGKLIIVDNDFRFHLRTHPEIPGLKDLYDAYCAARIEAGGDPHVGTRLPLIFGKHGLVDLEFSALTAHSALKGDEIFLRSESSSIGTMLVRQGYLSPESFDNVVKSWRELIGVKGHCFTRMLFVCIGSRGQGLTGTKGSDAPEKRPDSRNSGVREPGETGTERGTGNADGFLIDFLKRSFGPYDFEFGEAERHVPLVKFGLNSVNSMDLEDAILSAYGVRVPAFEMLDGATIAGLSGKILSVSPGEAPEAKSHEEGII